MSSSARPKRWPDAVFNYIKQDFFVYSGGRGCNTKSINASTQGQHEAQNPVEAGGRQCRRCYFSVSLVVAAPLKELRLDYAYYSPASLVLKRFGWLEEDFKADGVQVRWVLSAGSNARWNI
jgi:hypothetical protein